jgi:hypothetical protein
MGYFIQCRIVIHSGPSDAQAQSVLDAGNTQSG